MFSPIDLVVSGINNDTNLGYDINYSGTVGAALEAAAGGYLSLAFSIEKKEPFNWKYAGKLVTHIISLVPQWELPKGVVLNINIPHNITEKTLAFVPPQRTPASEDFTITQISPGVSEYLRVRDSPPEILDNDADVYYFKKGFVTVSPINPVGGRPELLQHLKLTPALIP
jgi:5'-nucleotidase